MKRYIASCECGWFSSSKEVEMLKKICEMHVPRCVADEPNVKIEKYVDEEVDSTFKPIIIKLK